MKGAIRGIIKYILKIADWAMTEPPSETTGTIYGRGQTRTDETSEEIHSLWDYLHFVENSQAFHLAGVVGFEEWVDMEEIKRRILELYGANYKNERSLYPYIKTLTDAGLFESTSTGGRKKWRKRELIIKIGGRKGGEEAVLAAKKRSG